MGWYVKKGVCSGVFGAYTVFFRGVLGCIYGCTYMLYNGVYNRCMYGNEGVKRGDKGGGI